MQYYIGTIVGWCFKVTYTYIFWLHRLALRKLFLEIRDQHKSVVGYIPFQSFKDVENK